MKQGSGKNRRSAKAYRLTGPVLLLVLVLVLLAFSGSIRNHFERQTSATSPSEQGAFSTQEPTGISTQTQTPALTKPSQETTPPEPTPAPENKPMTLAFVGDIILHQSVIDGGLLTSQEAGVYDFTPAFSAVKPIFQAADLSVANYEGTLAGPPYSGYPFFAAPDAIADALYQTGFRVVCTANNHMLDKGLEGLVRTARVFEERGFQVIGTRTDPAGRLDQLVSINGLTVGLMATTFETIGTESQKTLNGIPFPQGAADLLDSFNPYRQEAFAAALDRLVDRADGLRQEGAELICLSVHWGNEYETVESHYQRVMAQHLADAGIEVIIGHHPHVLQPIDVLTAANGSHTLVFYSISNFLHNMTFSTHQTAGYALDAVVARLTLARDATGVFVQSADVIPTTVVRQFFGEDIQHHIVPVLPMLEAPGPYEAFASELEAAWKRIQNVLASSMRTEPIPVAFSPQ